MAAKDPMLLRLGRHLRRAREARGWSQEDLSFECELHRTYVGAVERGEYNVTLLSLQRITKSLGISMTEAVAAAERRKSKG